jgi:hypothetical protein
MTKADLVQAQRATLTRMNTRLTKLNTNKGRLSLGQVATAKNRVVRETLGELISPFANLCTDALTAPFEAATIKFYNSLEKVPAATSL